MRRSLAVWARRATRIGSTTYPFISGDAVKSVCDYVFRQGRLKHTRWSHAPSDLDYSIIFTNSEDFESAIDCLAARGTPFVLACGNSDRNFYETPQLPPNCRGVYLQNYSGDVSDLVHRLPIGIENSDLGRYRYRKVLRPTADTRQMRAFFPPMRPTNDCRGPQKEFAKKHGEVFDVFEEYMHEKDYFRLASGYWFTVSLPGNGIEDHRVWESFYMGVFPIVIRSGWSRILMELDLPALLVDSLADVTPALLQQHVDMHRHFHPDSTPQLWMPFWRDRLASHTRV